MIRARGRGASAPAVALLLAPLLLAPARADVVHLTTGRPIRGQVVAEDDEQVVVHTASGRVTLPRRLVARIERESPGAGLLKQAREQRRLGAFEEAARLYEKAARDEDPTVAAEAERELAEVRERLGEPAQEPGEPTTPGASEAAQPAAPPAPPARPSSPLAAAAAAVRAGRGAEALERLAEVATQDDPRVRYLEGRAHELLKRAHPARQAYYALLAPLRPASTTPLDWIAELARRRASGEQVRLESAGAPPAWQRLASPHFALYHRLEQVPEWLPSEPEGALRDVFARLKVGREEVRLDRRILVFLFRDAADYKASGGMELAAGHAERREAPDGLMKQIRAYPDRNFYSSTLRHEVAHTVLFELYPTLPSWAHEGGAVYTETERSRARLRQIYQGRASNGQLPPLAELVAGRVPRGGDREAVDGFYAQAAVAFEALAQLLRSPREALALAEEGRRTGDMAAALAARKLTLRQLEQACAAVARR